VRCGHQGQVVAAQYSYSSGMARRIYDDQRPAIRAGPHHKYPAEVASKLRSERVCMNGTLR